MESNEEAGVDGAADSGPKPDSATRILVRSAWEWSRTVLVALTIFLALRAMLIEAFMIPTGSMEGTLLVGDFLLVNKAVYGARIPGTDLQFPAFAEPRRGDVVVFKPTHDPETYYVKRVVGTPGDTVEMRDKTLFVNGAELEEEYARYIDARGDAVHPDMEWQASHLVASPSRYIPSRDTWGPIVVPADKFFVLGDNRDNSEDSRYWGFVDRSRIRGRPWIVYYSSEPFAPGTGLLDRVRWSRMGHRVH